MLSCVGVVLWRGRLRPWFKVAEALNRIGGKSAADDMDLASFLSQLDSKVPKRFVRRNFATMVGKRRGSVYRR